MRQNMDQNNSEYGYFSRNGCYITNANDFFPLKIAWQNFNMNERSLQI